ncbi:MAG: hypothetical protein AAB425_08525, partial [Bdellovibrionota bacterium]
MLLALAAGGLSSTGWGAEPQRIIVPIFVESIPAGEFPIWVGTPPETSSLETQTLVPALTPFLDESHLQGLKSRRQTSLKELRDLGLLAEFDESTVSVRILIPTALR